MREVLGAGLAKLLEKLEEDKVPKDPKFNRTAVNDWWRAQFSAELGLQAESEEYLSNWFPVTLPELRGYSRTFVVMPGGSESIFSSGFGFFHRF